METFPYPYNIKVEKDKNIQRGSSRWSSSTRFLSGNQAISEKSEARRENRKLIPCLALFSSRLGLAA